MRKHISIFMRIIICPTQVELIFSYENISKTHNKYPQTEEVPPGKLVFFSNIPGGVHNPSLLCLYRLAIHKYYSIISFNFKNIINTP